MNASPSLKHTSVLSNVTRSDANMTLNIDDVLRTAPPLQPRWTKTLIGSGGSRAYVDMRGCVWAHALVSVFAFITLALFSTQVNILHVPLPLWPVARHSVQLFTRSFVFSGLRMHLPLNPRLPLPHNPNSDAHPVGPGCRLIHPRQRCQLGSENAAAGGSNRSWRRTGNSNVSTAGGRYVGMDTPTRCR